MIVTETPCTQMTAKDYTVRVHGTVDINGLKECIASYGRDFLVGDFFDHAFHGSGNDYVSNNILDHPSTDWFVPIDDITNEHEDDHNECGNTPYGVISWTSDGCYGDGWTDELASDVTFDRQYTFEIVMDDDAFGRRTCFETCAMFIPNGDIDEERFDSICENDITYAFAEHFSQTIGMLTDMGLL